MGVAFGPLSRCLRYLERLSNVFLILERRKLYFKQADKNVSLS